MILTRTCKRTFKGGPSAWYCPECGQSGNKNKKNKGPYRKLSDTTLIILSPYALVVSLSTCVSLVDVVLSVLPALLSASLDSAELCFTFAA